MTAEVIYYAASSLDGFIADKDGGVEWLNEFHEGMEGFGEFMASIDLILMGRKTYDQILGFGCWPYGETPTGIITSRPCKLEQEQATVLPPEIDAIREYIETSDAKRVWVVGGAQTAGFLAEAGLVSLAQVFVIPIFLGEGIPLFTPGFKSAKPTLSQMEKIGAGIVRLDYTLNH